ncbi:LysR family transcriptional regulator [Streptomyces sp. NPDC093085]|uniref:LysR family transcriptional regulator n=1 Tax=Streptomyces sp. NPDC093085 TaxID=3155068 RepID=UPI00341BB428
MELRHLKYFVAVAEELNFTRAARRLHIAQSGLSAAIQNLEHDLGLPLFERTSKHVALTDAGSVLLPEARSTLAAARAARDAVDQVRGGLRGTLTIGTMITLGLLDLPALIGRFHAEHPDVVVRLHGATRGSTDLARAVVDGTLDAAFLSLPGPPPTGLVFRRLASAPMVVIVPADHALAHQDTVALGTLADESFIDSPVGYGNRTLVDQHMAAAHLHRQVSMEVHDVRAAADYVRHGLGIAIVPDYAVPADDHRLRVLELHDCSLYWELAIATPAQRRPSAVLRALLRMIDAHIHENPPGAGRPMLPAPP